MTKETQDRYFKIFELKRRGLNVVHIAQELGVSQSTVQRALRWVIENDLGFSREDDLVHAVAQKDAELARLNERLERFQEGWEEVKRTEYSNGSLEVTTTHSFAPSAEIALFRLIHKTQDEINRLRELLERVGNSRESKDDGSKDFADRVLESLQEMNRATVKGKDCASD